MGEKKNIYLKELELWERENIHLREHKNIENILLGNDCIFTMCSEHICNVISFYIPRALIALISNLLDVR